ncbi:ubiquitin-conjugating enzyme E2 J2 [Cimex lectularius]|uniref:Ubiquitin-conjugating enzyme E2 J2 n=1 Tax=Cimex lectularius TaxID=79782 RepID=A0A8I6S6J2_CIMLE|nr:ubiquitin-conjugating enzyme E2 J2 [Cimex lectularius]
MSRRANTATARLKQDYLRLKRDPVPYVVAEPNPSNILEWHYVVFGPKNSPYEGGMYHGKLLFPREFPFKPPSIYMITPNGRFRPNTRLCLSISDFHPDTWNPAWSVSTILTGLLSFMLEQSPTLGSIETTEDEKRQHAYRSLSINLKDPQFCDQFPSLLPDIKKELERRELLEEEARKRQMAEGGLRGQLNSQTVQSDASALSSAISNIFVVIGVAAFVLAVKYVVGTTPME